MTQDLTGFRPSRLWRRMPLDRRTTAAELFWTDEQSAEQQMEAVAAIASHMKFRPRSVMGLPIERLTKYLATLPAVPDTVAARALVNYHLARQRPMMAAFLDTLGIPHEEGLISEETVPKPDPDKLKQAAATLGAQYPGDEVTLYLSTLVSQDPETWGGLVDVVQASAT
ncbi:MAG TPA: hypothetical protein VFK20_11860 [Vicinamibacterales bacterium]|nr:hypothetical protein [Vicinamibacterales bacterium]